MSSPRKVTLQTRLIVVVLWLLTLILGAACVVFGQGRLVLVLTRLIGAITEMDTVRARATVGLVYNCTFALGWIIWLGLFIGGAEYHLSHSGQRRSNRILFTTLAIEITLIGLILLSDIL